MALVWGWCWCQCCHWCLLALALVLVLVSILFWLSIGLDWGYFQARSLELPVWFRKAFSVLTVCSFAAGCMAWIVFRWLRSFQARSLALVLEKRFPELRDRMITAVEWSQDASARGTELTESMYDRTVQEVKLITDRDTGRPRGFGFVEMGSQQDADAAIQQLNGYDLDGRQLNVNEARERTGGGGRGNGGFGRF